MNFNIILIWILGIALGWMLQRWRIRNLRADLRDQFRIADDLRSAISGAKPWLSGQVAVEQAVAATAADEPLSASSVQSINTKIIVIDFLEVMEQAAIVTSSITGIKKQLTEQGWSKEMAERITHQILSQSQGTSA
jgi:hypothetical protein